MVRVFRRNGLKTPQCQTSLGGYALSKAPSDLTCPATTEGRFEARP